MENKNIDALGVWMAAYKDPMGTIKDFDGIFRFMGAVNQLTYGINPYAKAELEPLIPQEVDEEAMATTFPPDEEVKEFSDMSGATNSGDR